MLSVCAPGSTIERKKHRYWIRFNGLLYHGLPTGGHGSKNPQIQIGHVKKMIRQLGVDVGCAKEHLAILR